MSGNIDKELIKDGIRLDGRKPNELRDIKIEAGVLNRADGSAYVEWGYNKVLAAVYGPTEVHPKHLMESNKAIIQCKYNMAAFSVSDRKRPGPDRRSVEISKVIKEAIDHTVLTEKFPRASITVLIEILQANAGTRVAGLTAASVALADAGIPMKGLIQGCAVGKVGDTVVLDLDKEEDNFGQADLPVGMLNGPDGVEFVLMQMDGDMTPEEINKGFSYLLEAREVIEKLQRDALERKYSKKV